MEQGDYDDNTALHWASEKGHIEVARAHRQAPMRGRAMIGVEPAPLGLYG